MATLDRAFCLLPYELNKIIALYIENDVDFCSFQLVCKQTYWAVNSDQSVWRDRFLNLYDRPPAGSDFKSKYCVRRKTLRAGATFTGGYTKGEGKCLRILRELILESCASKDGMSSLNLDRILNFCHSTNILEDILHAGNLRPDPLLATVQLILTPLCLDIDLNFSTWGFPDSQQAAYLDSKVPEGQIFFGRNNQGVNMRWLLHISNFFKYHMTRKEEYSLYEDYENLEVNERPKMWAGKLEDQAPGLKRDWKGSYAFLDAADVTHLRQSHFAFTDVFIDNMDGLQNMEMRPISKVSADVTALFELFDRSDASRVVESSAANEMDRNALYYDAAGYDHYPFGACIRVNPLQVQHGIPGWQRFSMVKYFHSQVASNLLVGDLWAYEGCVLPGGEVILGRWFYLDPNIPASGAESIDFDAHGPYSGPFIFWGAS